VTVLERAKSDRDLFALIEDFFRNSFATDNALITEAVRRMLDAGGKRLRPRFTLLGAAAMGSTDVRSFLPLAAYMELIHVATLIHDDVVDHADKRRGVNATAVDFGNRVSVLAGDYLFAWIFKSVTATYAHPIPHILSATLADITDGEVLQLRALGNLDATVVEYIEIAAKKTARLFSSSAECGGYAAGGSSLKVASVREFGKAYGIAFQMQDDLLDMTSTEAALGKPVGNDLTEKKMTIPVIFALESGGREFRADLERFYAEDDTSPERLSGVIAAIAANGGFERTRAAISEYIERAKAALAPIGNAPARAEFVAIADALIAG
jgi:geranylgeranyl pyrophosphate synthase